MNTLRELEHSVRQSCRDQDIPIEPEALAATLRSLQPVLPRSQRLEVIDALIVGSEDFGPLEPLLDIPQVTDILINAPDEVWVDCGQGLQRVACTWRDEQDLRDFAMRLANLSHRRLDEANPWVDAQLPNGIRMHAVIPPLSVQGTALSLRIPAPSTFTLETMVASDALSVRGFNVLLGILSAGLSFIVCGGTGTGKTTMLAAMLARVTADQRIVVVEDSAELAIAHPHVVSLQTRVANTEGVGAISLHTLIRQALRMRPDRLIVGEVRGVEVADLLNALNTGHAGSGTTVHANSAQSVPERIESLGLLAGMPRDAIHAQLVCGVKVIIQMAKVADHAGDSPLKEKHRRVVHSVHVLKRNSQGFAQVIPALDFVTDLVHPDGASMLFDLLGQSL